MADRASFSVELLGLIAHVPCPATGSIDMARLAVWLCLSRAELEARWLASGWESWAHFASEVLCILDVMHDKAMDLAATLVWYRHEPIALLGVTADEAVTHGADAAVGTTICAQKSLFGVVIARKKA